MWALEGSRTWMPPANGRCCKTILAIRIIRIVQIKVVIWYQMILEFIGHSVINFIGSSLPTHRHTNYLPCLDMFGASLQAESWVHLATLLAAIRTLRFGTQLLKYACNKHIQKCPRMLNPSLTSQRHPHWIPMHRPTSDSPGIWSISWQKCPGHII